MKKYLLPSLGKFYKANLHCHTTLSNGRKTPEEIKKIYQDKGYSIVAFTDHKNFITHNELSDNDFLALNGFEVSVNEDKSDGLIKCCHICLVSLDKDKTVADVDCKCKYDGKSISALMEDAREKGFFVTYNHPSWSREAYPDYMSYSGMHAIEMFNGAAISKGYEEYNPREYDDILSGGREIFCVGGDDNHNAFDVSSRYCDSGWAYTVIKSEKLDYQSIAKALLNGNFYASEGPEIYELYYEDEKVHIKCSEADRIYCTYYVRKAESVLSENDIPVTEAVFNVPEEVEYFRVTVVDKQGRRACTNAYFIKNFK